MKAWLAVAALVLSTSALAQRTVLLDDPGSLEALQRGNPAHFAKVQRILQEAPRLPVSSLQGWIRTQFDARDVTAPFLMKASYPAQARISFRLDDVRYSTVIRLDAPPKAVPAEKK